MRYFDNKNRAGFGFAPAAAATVGGDPYTSLIGMGVQLFSKVVGAFTGDTEPESFQKQMIPFLTPVARNAGAPAFVYWYGYIWGITPQGQIVDITPPGAYGTLLWDDSFDIVQDWSNRTGSPALGYFDGWDLFLPGGWNTQDFAEQQAAERAQAVVDSGNALSIAEPIGEESGATGSNILILGGLALGGLIVFSLATKAGRKRK